MADIYPGAVQPEADHLPLLSEPLLFLLTDWDRDPPAETRTPTLPRGFGIAFDKCIKKPYRLGGSNYRRRQAAAVGHVTIHTIVYSGHVRKSLYYLFFQTNYITSSLLLPHIH